jgi:elongation factor P hydroxylase
MKPSTLLIAAIMALALSFHSLNNDGQPDEITVMRKVQATVMALEIGK